MHRPLHLKVCCIQDPAEAALAIAHGATALGFVGPMPSGPGTLVESRIAEIARSVPPGISRFLLSAESELAPLVAQLQETRVEVVQLVRHVPAEVHRGLRSAIPGLRVVQVIHVEGPDSVAEAKEAAQSADALLLDSGRPSAATPELGGTGRTHDWALSREIVQAVDKPVWLAGGLRPENVAQAVRDVGPFGLDVCSGLRSEGGLDAERLAAFTEAIARSSTGVPGPSSAGP